MLISNNLGGGRGTIVCLCTCVMSGDSLNWTHRITSAKVWLTLMLLCLSDIYSTLRGRDRRHLGGHALLACNSTPGSTVTSIGHTVNAVPPSASPSTVWKHIHTHSGCSLYAQRRIVQPLTIMWIWRRKCVFLFLNEFVNQLEHFYICGRLCTGHQLSAVALVSVL